MKNFKILKISLLFVFFFLCYGLNFSAIAAQNFNIPAELGTIKEAFEATGTGPTIIQIQDAHCNYEAQKKMAGLLEYLVKQYGLRLIMVEGGSGDVSLTFLRGYSDKKSREEVADKYLKEGKISGEEYLDIVSDYPLELYGIENRELYDAHLAVFEKVDSLKEQGLAYLNGLSLALEGLKAHIYSGELNKFETVKKDYLQKNISLSGYCQALETTARARSVNLNDYPNLVSFSEVARLEKEIDFKAVEAQRSIFIKNLAPLLNEKEIKTLLARSEDFKVKKIAAQEYYSFLKSAGEGKLDLRNNYPELFNYINYISLSKDINAGELLKEAAKLQEKTEEALLVNDEQKKLAEISKSLEVLTKILNLELTPEDYEYFKANRLKFMVASWADFLNGNSSKYNLALKPGNPAIIDDNLAQLENFYKLGVSREKAFVKNLINKMKGSDQSLAVLITGGFHTPGITKILKEEGYSYIVAAPLVTGKSDSSIYFSVLRSKKSQPEEIIDEE